MRQVLFSAAFCFLRAVPKVATGKPIWYNVRLMDGGIASEALHSDGFDAEVVDEFVGAAGGVYGHSFSGESANDVLKAVLVEDRDEG